METYDKNIRPFHGGKNEKAFPRQYHQTFRPSLQPLPTVSRRNTEHPRNMSTILKFVSPKYALFYSVDSLIPIAALVLPYPFSSCSFLSLFFSVSYRLSTFPRIPEYTERSRWLLCRCSRRV